MVTCNKRPEPGASVSVTVHSPIKARWAEIGRRASCNVDTYQGMVIELSWLPKNQFGLSTEDSRFPVRVITCDNVIAINGNQVKFAIVSGDREVTINSNTDSQQYTVKIRDGKPISCTCKGFGFRRSCKHLQQALDSIK